MFVLFLFSFPLSLASGLFAAGHPTAESIDSPSMQALTNDIEEQKIARNVIGGRWGRDRLADDGQIGRWVKEVLFCDVEKEVPVRER
jgi:hypothetical protein